jgi:stage IV sporulation protein FB
VADRSHFRIAGIPVRIEPIFWIVTVFFAFNLSDARLIIMWVGVVLVSLLVHELGHAVALKVYGHPSSIVLHGFGGVTLSNRRLTRGRSIVVSLAGPLAAIVLLGIPAYYIRESDYGVELWYGYVTSESGFGLWPVIVFSTYVNIWWSIANLLPIRPLDGGNVMTELIGIDRARILSIGFGAAAAVWAYRYAEPGFRYAAFFAAFLAFINFSEYRRSRMGAPAPSAFDVEGPVPGASRPVGGETSGGSRGGGRPRRPPVRRPTGPPPAPAVLAGGIDPAAAESFAWNLLRRGDAAGARRTLARSTGDVGPFVRATVDLACGDGIDALVAAYVANPSGPSNLVPATVAADSGAVLHVARALVDAGPPGIEAASGIQTHLHYGERFEHAAAVGEIVYARQVGARAQTAFDVACSLARSGETERALIWIGRAIDDGFVAAAVVDGEPDLDPVRTHPGWPEVRARLT